MCHWSGASTTPSSEMNTATVSLRIGISFGSVPLHGQRTARRRIDKIKNFLVTPPAGVPGVPGLPGLPGLPGGLLGWADALPDDVERRWPARRRAALHRHGEVRGGADPGR